MSEPSTDETEKRIRAKAAALAAAAKAQRRQASIKDYVYDKAQEAYWDIIDGTLHGKDAVDASIPLEGWRLVEAPSSEGGRGRPKKDKLVPPSTDVKRIENNQFVESSTWWPGQDVIINDFLITGDGCRPMPGRRAFNTYVPPPHFPPTKEKPDRWVNHIKKLWPEEIEHNFFFDYCAHMIQRPEEKCNAAIVMSGTQGIGKDAALVPVKMAVGEWNSKNIDPDNLFDDYRPWLQTLMLVVDEVRPSKDEFHASSMYNTLKPIIAAPPNTLPLNDKYMKMRHIVNVVRTFLTTNDWLAMYVPEEDRRLFIMHSKLPAKWYEMEGRPNYFADYWAWVEGPGIDAVHNFLMKRDISKFNPKANIAKTQGWHAVAGSWAPVEDGIEAVLRKIGSPPVVFAKELAEGAFDYKEEITAMIRAPRKISHRMLKAGYSLVRPPSGDSWRFQSAETGRDVESRLVFVREADFDTMAKAYEAIREHGKALAARPKESGNF